MERWHRESDGTLVELLVVVPGPFADVRVALIVSGQDACWAELGRGSTQLPGADGSRVDVHVGLCGVTRAVLVTDRDRLDLKPPDGKVLATVHAWGRAHPRTWALRHAGRGAAQAAVVLVSIGLVLRWSLPDWFLRLPDLHLPDIPWPSIPWPDVDLFDWRLPGPLRWLADNRAWVVPVTVGVTLSGSELLRRRRRARRRERGGSAGIDARRDADHDG